LEYFLAQKWWELDELRGSRPVLRGAEAEMPRSTHLYLRLNKQFVYLVAFIDVYSRYIVGWQLAYDLETENSLEALRLSLKSGKPEIINSDQGRQYTSEIWLKTLATLMIQVSHDGIGRWADNIYIERFWRSIKYEAIFLNEFEHYEELYSGVRDYIDFYNHERPHQSLNYKTPAEIYQQVVCT
jgi:putative transposase